MRFYNLFACLFVCSTFYACSKAEVEPEETTEASEYYLLTHFEEDFIKNGIVSKFSYSENVVESNIIAMDHAPTNELFSDAVLYQDHLYLVRQRTGIIDKVRISDNSVVARWQASELADASENTRYDKTIEIVNNQVVIAYRKPLEPGQSDAYTFATYLKFFNTSNLHQTDSVFLQYDYDILDFKNVKNKVFISLQRPGGNYGNLLMVLDSETKQSLTEIQLELPTTQFMVTSDEQLLALTSRSLHQIDPNNYAVTDLGELNAGTSLNSSTPTAALDTENNILYYYAPTAQPAPTPFYLASLNLNNLERANLSGYDLNLNVNSPIAYDSMLKAIVISTEYQDSNGIGNKLLMLDETGEVLQEAISPNTIYKILIRN